MRIGAHVDSTRPARRGRRPRRRRRAVLPRRPAGLEGAEAASADAEALRAADAGRLHPRAVPVNVATAQQPHPHPAAASCCSQHADGGGRARRQGPDRARRPRRRGRRPRRPASTTGARPSSTPADSGGFPLPILIENTAGGDNACARRFDALARLWDAVGEFGAGFCLDTCHAHAGGEELLGIVDRVKAITGRIDLVHANDSRDDVRLRRATGTTTSATARSTPS